MAASAVWVKSFVNQKYQAQKNATKDPGVTKDHKDELKNGTYRYAAIQGQLYVDGISANDVNQGFTGDCYFLASLAALADTHPKFIRESIRSNPDGNYTVRFFDKIGRPIFINVDSDFFVDKKESQRYASSDQKTELWVSLVEKAYAKWKGGYQKISGGFHRLALSEITGESVTYFKPGTWHSDKLYSWIDNANQLITANTYDKSYKNSRLIAKHVYTVLGVTTENGQKFVTLRNPHGNTEYFDEWNQDGDTLVNGVFKIPIEEYQKQLDQTAITKTNPIDMPNFFITNTMRV